MVSLLETASTDQSPEVQVVLKRIQLPLALGTTKKLPLDVNVNDRLLIIRLRPLDKFLFLR